MRVTKLNLPRIRSQIRTPSLPTLESLRVVSIKLGKDKVPIALGKEEKALAHVPTVPFPCLLPPYQRHPNPPTVSALNRIHRPPTQSFADLTSAQKISTLSSVNTYVGYSAPTALRTTRDSEEQR